MTAVRKPETMSAEAFLEWAEAQPSGRHQLIGGEIVAMAPERAEHVHVKRQIAKRSTPLLRERASPAAPSLTVSA